MISTSQTHRRMTTHCVASHGKNRPLVGQNSRNSSPIFHRLGIKTSCVVAVVVVTVQQLISYHQLSRLRKSVTVAGLSHRLCHSVRETAQFATLFADLRHIVSFENICNVSKWQN